MPHENSLKNLEKGAPYRFRSGDEQAKEIQRKGGINSGKTRRERARLVDEVNFILSCSPKLTPELKAAYKKMGIPVSEGMDYRRMAVASLVSKASKGDWRCARLVFNLSGETQDAQLNQLKIIEGEQKIGLDKVQGNGSDVFDMRRTLDEMTDEEFEQYERLCAMFTPDDAQAGGEDE